MAPITTLDPHALYLAAVSLVPLFLCAIALARRKRLPGELGVSDPALRALIGETSDIVFVKDRLGRYVYVNEAAAREFGLPAEGVLGKDLEALLLPAEEADRMRALEQEVMREGQPRTTEDVLTLAGGTGVYHSTRTPYRDPSGLVVGVAGVSRDITARKSEEATRAWLAAIVDSSADAVIGETLRGTIMSWNAAAERIYGYTSEEAIGQSIDAFVPPDKREELATFFERVRRGERISSHETARCRKDGMRIDVAVTMSPVCDAAGSIIGVSAIARDITERKQVERELRESEERQRLAVEAAQLAMWFWDIESDRVVWTPLGRRMYGIGSEEEMSYRQFLTTLHPDDRESTERTVQRAIQERADYRHEHRAIWPDGSQHWIAAHGRAFYDAAGRPERMLGVSMDVTMQKQAEGERAELLAREQTARAEAQAAARAKDDFLAVISHELRTPLQAMVGWTHLLRQRRHDEQMMQKGLEAIERSIKTLTRLVEDLLDVSRIVAGKLRLEQRRVDLGRVVRSALESVKPLADAKSIRIDAAIEPPACEVLGDPDRLHQIVSNLLSNAVKFTPSRGHVGVRLERLGSAARLVVEDAGCGIRADFLPLLFDRFRQAESAITRQHGGLGLGLAIVRHLVEAHGGTVSAESVGEGQGATFTVTLPLVGGERGALAAEQDKTSGDPPPARVALDGVRVLLVDDDVDSCEVLWTTLQDTGADVRTVHSAHDALAEIEAFRPEVLISDVGMPDEDGYALIRAVRARAPKDGGNVPAIALTAFASPADRDEAVAQGFDAHLAKPVSPSELARTAARLVERAT